MQRRKREQVYRIVHALGANTTPAPPPRLATSPNSPFLYASTHQTLPISQSLVFPKILIALCYSIVLLEFCGGIFFAKSTNKRGSVVEICCLKICHEVRYIVV